MAREFMLKMGLGVLAYLSPLYEIFAIMMLFVAADFIMGLIASHKCKIPRSSRRFRKSAYKLACYLAVMILSFAAEKAFHAEWFAAHLAVGGFICMVEFISILENMTIATEHPVFITIMKWIRGKATDRKQLINEMLNEKNK